MPCLYGASFITMATLSTEAEVYTMSPICLVLSRQRQCSTCHNSLSVPVSVNAVSCSYTSRYSINIYLYGTQDLCYILDTTVLHMKSPSPVDPCPLLVDLTLNYPFVHQKSRWYDGLSFKPWPNDNKRGTVSSHGTKSSSKCHLLDIGCRIDLERRP